VVPRAEALATGGSGVFGTTGASAQALGLHVADDALAGDSLWFVRELSELMLDSRGLVLSAAVSQSGSSTQCVWTKWSSGISSPIYCSILF